MQPKIFNKKVSTFSIIDEDPRYNEETNIIQTVKDINCENHLIRISQERNLDRLEQLIKYHDAPIATISYYLHSILSQKVRENGNRIIFSGTSADELFTGYYDHFLLHLKEVRSEPNYICCLQKWEKHVSGLIRNEHLKNPDLYHSNPQFRDHIFDGSKTINEYLVNPWNENFREHYFTSCLLRNRMLNELFFEATPVILNEDDLNSMYTIQ